MKFNVGTNRHHLSRRKPRAPRRPMSWIDTPVDEEETRKRLRLLESNNSGQAASSTGTNQVLQQDTHLEKGDTFDSRHLSEQNSSQSHSWQIRSRRERKVVFKPRHESTAIELFYDLFFVANLTVYTSNNEIESAQAMGNYIAYFTLLWFNWLQVSLFDVRFATNSVWSRLCKAGALFPMGLFAFASPPFSTFDLGFNAYLSFKAMCYGLLIQRGILVLQYGLVLYQTRKYHGATMPLALTTGTLFITCMIFMGLIFTFHPGVSQPTYYALYVVSVVEGLAVMGISCYFRTISFRSTNLVERIGLLTLIVLGEGVIGVIRAIATILLNVAQFTHTMVGIAFVAILVLHELWILYFDQVDHDRFGTIRQQIWTLLHFPLHMALILTMQGNSRFVIWKSWYDGFRIAYLPNFQPPNLFENSTVYAEQLQQNLTTFSNYFITPFSGYYNWTSNLTYFEQLDFETQKGQTAAALVYNHLGYQAGVYGFKVLDIEPPEVEENTPRALYEASVQVFVVSYIYFIVGAGFFLILLGIMYWFGKASKSRHEWASVMLRIVSGIALTLVALTARGDGDSHWSIVYESWTIPIVLFIYGFVIGVDDVLIWLGWRRYEQTRDVDNEEAPDGQEDALGRPAG